MTGGDRPYVRVVPLDDHHVRGAFTSGVEPLDRYFRIQAGQDIRKRVSSCFVLIDDRESIPMGFYTLSATSIALADLPVALAKRLPRYPTVPATLMGRLAVDADHRGKRFGELLLFDASSRVLRSEIATFAVVTDAKDNKAAGFYKGYGFRPLSEGGSRMFLPITDVARLFA